MKSPIHQSSLDKLAVIPGCGPGQALIVLNLAEVKFQILGKKLWPCLDYVRDHLQQSKVSFLAERQKNQFIPPLLIMLTAASGGYGAGCNHTDKNARNRWIAAAPGRIYEVHLLHHLNCGGVGIHSVNQFDKKGRRIAINQLD